MNPKILAALTLPLLAAGIWEGFKGGECADVKLICKWSEADGGLIQSPHEEVVMARGGVVPEKIDPSGLYCEIAKGGVGGKYACSPVGDPVVRYDDAHSPVDGCACSDGSEGCETIDPASDPKDPKWVKAPRAATTFDPGKWRGTCPPKACTERAEMVSGIGAVNVPGYSIPAACGGPGKKPPSGTVMTADQVAKSDAAKSAEVVK